ncbi:hypothetical protein CEW92_13475 [Bacillaceae bacterium SAS-127]|nr:hypothetical protein CEW92_13475 [Bacillaceae bacterium SAS-127]
MLTKFDADQPFTQTLSADIELPDSPNNVELAKVRLAIDQITDRVWLNGTIGWLSTSGEPIVHFFITRTRPGGTEETIFSTSDKADQFDVAVTTSFTFVDETPILTQEVQLVEYRLRAHTLSEGNATVVGPVIFTGAEMSANP